MKKLLILITFLMLSVVFSYADNVRVGTLGYPVISFNDTSILDLFPSRIQDMGGSSVFFSLDSALNAVPGVILNTGKLMGLEYLFNAPTRNRPAALTANALYTLSGGSLPARLASPLYLVYGADLGFIKAGLCTWFTVPTWVSSRPVSSGSGPTRPAATPKGTPPTT